MPVLLHSDELLAWSQAHSHLAVNTPGVLRRWLQILAAAAHLKQIAEPGLKLVRGRARPEWPIVERGGAPDVRGHLAPRERIIQKNLHIWRESQTQHVQVCFRKMDARELV